MSIDSIEKDEKAHIRKVVEMAFDNDHLQEAHIEGFEAEDGNEITVMKFEFYKVLKGNRGNE